MHLPYPERRIAVIGDVHAEDELLSLALATLRNLGVHQLLCVGDIVDGPGNVDRCCELLRQNDVITVRGNHDKWMLDGTLRSLRQATRREDLSSESIDYLESLPPVRCVRKWLPGGLLCHGLGPNDMASVLPDDFGYALEVKTELHDLIADPGVEIVLNGHTHRRLVRHFQGVTIINAGSLVFSHEPGIVLIEPQSGDVSWLSLQEADGNATSVLGAIRPELRQHNR
jgi:predicted phosphodiesterase